ncbi:hypothetical protein FACS1894163_11290 [Spirochaetia bacterium]|nr:hypothetical protein FACS1894163_11290 [Spirochaetia bacterium]
MATLQTDPVYETGVTFEKVWALFQEIGRKQEENARIIKEVGRKQEETDRQIKETGPHGEVPRPRRFP